MSKYALLPEQLLHEGTVEQSNLFAPVLTDEKWIVQTHHPDYYDKLQNLTLTPQEIRRTGFPLTRELIDREVCIMNGTIACTRFAIEHGISMNIAGGTHHAFTNRGEGFCLLNDQAIGSNYVLANTSFQRILIVDLDVHQGNGTAEIFRQEPRVFTFSMHGANNYPLIKEQSDLDIPLADFTSDKVYLDTLYQNLDTILNTFQPQFMFFQSGVDILDTDKLGRLAVSREGCRKRDEIVLTIAKKNKIPVVVCMGGGYSPDFRDIIEAHANTFRAAQHIFF